MTVESGAHRVSGFLYALRREVLRNGTVCLDGDAVHELFLYALRREVLRNARALANRWSGPFGSFYTPFGVRCFGTLPPWTGR